MAINIAGQQILAQPVSAFLQGRAVRLAEQESGARMKALEAAEGRATAQEQREQDLFDEDQKIKNTQVLYRALSEIEAAEDPAATAENLARSPEISEIFQRIGKDPTEGFREKTPDQIRQEAARGRQRLEPLIGKPKVEPLSSQGKIATDVKRGILTPEQGEAALSSDSEMPSSVQEWNFYNKLPTDEMKRQYLEMKRNPNIVVRDVAGVPTAISPSVTQTTQTPLSTLQDETDAKSALAGAGEAGKIEGGAQAQARIDMPKLEDRANDLLSQLSTMKTHPGFSAAVGAKGPTNLLPGTEAANFKALVDQVGGTIFLQAFQELKGGGHITEIEGQKAEQAVARIRNRDQSEAGYLRAIEDLEGIVMRGLERARSAAGATKEDPLGLRQ